MRRDPVETIFSWPGLGSLFYEALTVPDLPLLEGTFIFFSAAVIVMNLLAELCYPLLDPRVAHVRDRRPAAAPSARSAAMLGLAVLTGGEP